MLFIRLVCINCYRHQFELLNYFHFGGVVCLRSLTFEELEMVSASNSNGISNEEIRNKT